MVHIEHKIDFQFDEQTFENNGKLLNIKIACSSKYPVGK